MAILYSKAFRSFPSAMKRMFWGLAMVLGGLTLLSGADDSPADRVETFRRQLEKEKPEDDGHRGWTQNMTQLALMESALRQANYERARQMLSGLSLHGISSDLQAQWAGLVAGLAPKLDELEAAAAEEWRQNVDSLVKDVRDACLAAEKASDLDRLLVRCAALQMKSPQMHSLLAQRVTFKLSGVATTLELWMKHLDFLRAGNAKTANDMLRSLAGNTSGYPVLEKAEVEGRIVTEDRGRPLEFGEAVARAFDDITSPAQMPEAIERVEAIMNDPKNRNLRSSLESELKKFVTLHEAHLALQTGEVEAAEENMEKLRRTGSGRQETAAYLERLSEPIAREILLAKLEHAVADAKAAGVDGPVSSVITSALARLEAEGDHATMIEVMELSDRFHGMSGPGPESYFAVRSALKDFLSAERFEAANDFSWAAAKYRQVVGVSVDQYVPKDKAGAALKRILSEHPDAADDQTAIVIEALRRIELDLRHLRLGPGIR